MIYILVGEKNHNENNRLLVLVVGVLILMYLLLFILSISGNSTVLIPEGLTTQVTTITSIVEVVIEVVADIVAALVEAAIMIIMTVIGCRIMMAINLGETTVAKVEKVLMTPLMIMVTTPEAAPKAAPSTEETIANVAIMMTIIIIPVTNMVATGVVDITRTTEEVAMTETEVAVATLVEVVKIVEGE